MEEKLLDLLAELCEEDEVKNNLDEDLFESGLMDSLAFAELLFAIEENFGVIIAPSEIQRSDINTANKIIRLVKERMNA
ncbi:MAG: D-alanine--poly(phosphoribitol) ligase subunit DltC [Clostridia bacterium]|nr:D-alanine--poly(phosphoribitol) ligase subunit DltC [Clostridia bacterium]MBP5779961.1 D-alanine--poly(phosphoribitol) ligase subunit DltC [Clostridia bacterium]MBR6052948.1 D-alanine--poly(phosphoribitol) ligase subunit DltC [Clostridia bacterium]